MAAQKRIRSYRSALGRIARNFFKERGISRSKRTEKMVRIFTDTVAEAMRNAKTSKEYTRSLETAKRKFLYQLRRL